MKSKKTHFHWDDLKYFHAIIEAGSLSAAARWLGTTQPTVSKKLDQLEARIGAKLVSRGPEGIEVSDVGERIWSMVQIMHSTADDIERIAHQADKSEAGTVRVAAPEGICGFWIARHLPSFVEANPNIHLELKSNVEGEPSLDDADIKLQMTESKRINYLASELAVLHYTPFAARSYLDLYGPPESVVDVLNHRIGDLVSYTQQQNHWPKEASAIKQMMAPSLTTDSSFALIEAVKAGAIITLLPTYVAKYLPELVHIDMDLRVPISLYMVYHPDQRRVTRVRKTLDWLTEIFDPVRYPWFRKDFVYPADFGDTHAIHVRGERPKPKLI